MTGSVIVRGGTAIIDDRLVHDDNPLPWPEADLRAGFRLDRRKSWAFIEGRLCYSASWTAACSGCAYGFEERGAGCHECGHTGRRRQGMWVPFSKDREE